MRLDDIFYGSTNQLLRDNRFCIDEEFFNRRLRFRSLQYYKIIKKRLGDIRYGTVHLRECSPFLYLKGNIEDYKIYCHNHQQVLHINMSVNRYNNLISSIKNNGFNSKSMIIITDENKLLDGQHRACVLLYCYGEDYEIPVLYLKLKKRNFIQKLQRTIFKIFHK